MNKVIVLLTLVVAGALAGYFLLQGGFMSDSPIPPEDNGDQGVPRKRGVFLGAWNQDGGRETFEDMIGRRAPLVGGGFDTDCQDGGREGTRPKIDIACREARSTKGYVSTFAVETVVRVEDANGVREIPPDAITPQGILDGVIDADLRTAARLIAAFDKPIFWLYHREPLLQFGGYGADGTWPRPLCERNPNKCGMTAMFGDPAVEDGPERYRVVARHLYDTVENEIRAQGKKSKIIWVMGALSSWELEQRGFYTAWYPGSSYVDWHAFNWYPLEIGAKSIRKYESLSLTTGWQEAMALDPEKQVLILEFGVSANKGDRSAWFKSFFEDVRTNSAMKDLRGLIYWQEHARNQGGELIQTRVPKTEAESMVWRTEIEAYPDFWAPNLHTIQ